MKQMRNFGDQGWIAVDGLHVLPEQGKSQFELFTSRRAPIKLMYDSIFGAHRQRLNDMSKTAQNPQVPQT